MPNAEETKLIWLILKENPFKLFNLGKIREFSYFLFCMLEMLFHLTRGSINNIYL